ncbi:MAG: hypothetical protein M3164_08195 [Actinomycetota bacterium]|nr:hypothetical protein [Actinomycetota bacterium]
MSEADELVAEALEHDPAFTWKIQSIAAGVALCVGVGLLFSNILLGVALGLLTGILVGFALDYGLKPEELDTPTLSDEEPAPRVSVSSRPTVLEKLTA